MSYITTTLPVRAVVSRAMSGHPGFGILRRSEPASNALSDESVLRPTQDCWLGELPLRTEAPDRDDDLARQGHRKSPVYSSALPCTDITEEQRQAGADITEGWRGIAAPSTPGGPCPQWTVQEAPLRPPGRPSPLATPVRTDGLRLFAFAVGREYLWCEPYW